MITINLLPQEYRKRERTPLVLLLPILGGLACVLSAGAVAAYVHFAWLAEVVNEREILEQELLQKKPRLAYEENLLAEEAEYKKRADTIRGIASGRILMTKKLDEFCAITTQGDDPNEHDYLIWLKELKTSPPRPSRQRGKKAEKSGGEITVKGFAIADRDPLQHYNRYHAAIKNSDMFRVGFNDLSDPSGKIQDFTDERTPKKGWTIDFTMTMKDPVEARRIMGQDTVQAAKAEGR